MIVIPPWSTVKGCGGAQREARSLRESDTDRSCGSVSVPDNRAAVLAPDGYTPDELGRSVTYFPLVWPADSGFFCSGCIGFFLPSFRRRWWRQFCWVYGSRGSGALHFDGLLDAVDGLLGGRTAEDRMRILRDVSVGAFAVAAGGTMLLLKYAAIGGIGSAGALIVAPLLGRWVMSVTIALFPYARAEGLGREMKDNAGWPQVAWATAISMAALVVLAPFVGIAATVTAVVAVGLSAWLLIRFTLARIPGLTGDIYGALCEVGETVCIVTLAAYWSG